MRKFNVVNDIKDIRDLIYSERHKLTISLLPKSVDLRAKCSPVVDQGEIGSCTSNAIVSGLREYVLLNEERSGLVRLSRLYHYWWERDLEGTINEDSGASLRDGMKVIQKNGVCPEADWPYERDKLTAQPTDKINQEALIYRLSGYQRLVSIYDIKHALYNNHPAVFSMVVYESLESSVGSNGVVPVPQKNEQKLGGHAMCIVGYGDNSIGGCFIVRNSWGINWGDKGYCYLPYSMFKYVMDAWTVKYGRLFASDNL